VAVQYRVGGRVPDVQLPRAGSSKGGDIPARGRPREGVALLFPDAPDRWSAYVRDLAPHADALADWDGRLIAVVPDRDPAWAELSRELGARVWVVEDPDGRLRPAAVPAAPAPRLPAAALVDRYGEIYHVWPRDDHAARPGPPARELEEWLRFLALQCPE
jgi:hypothetical protein